MKEGDLVELKGPVDTARWTFAAGAQLLISAVMPQALGNRPGFGVDLLNLIDENGRQVISGLTADRVLPL